jgi:sugar/nucleoside kinase (ribokinase family)
VNEASGRRRDYYVRELRDWLPSPALDRMAPFTMGVYGELCSWTLARAHARSGDRIALAAYLGDDDEFERTTAEFAETYADQNLGDFRRLRRVAAVA